MRGDDEIDFDDMEDNEYTFGIDSDGNEYAADDHIRKYMSDMMEDEIESFEDLCDSAID